MSVFTHPDKVAEHPTADELLESASQDVNLTCLAIEEILKPAIKEIIATTHVFFIAYLRARLLCALSFLPPALAKRIAYGIPEWLVLRLPLDKTPPT